MNQSHDLLAPKAWLYGWLAAAAAFLLTLVIAAIGQGFGSILGGCYWIGITTPVHQPVWALVNLPSIAFSHQSAATGYWLGSTILPLLVAVLAVLAIPRSRSLAAELLWLQVAWAAAVVGGCWLPLLDTRDGHVARWLHFQEAAAWLVWIVPVLAAAAGLVPAIRLLALLRQSRRDCGRGLRIGVVLLYLVLPALAWVVLVTLIRGQLLLPPSLAVLVPVLTVLVLAWARYAKPFVHRLEELDGGNLLRILVLLVLMVAWVAVAGRPLAPDRASGLQWRTESSCNSIRPWVEPLRLFSTTGATSEPEANQAR
jgi:hypothetical protein